MMDGTAGVVDVGIYITTLLERSWYFLSIPGS